MNATPATLGSCPGCATAIDATQVLIEYRTSDGTAVYAECPECRLVDHPRPVRSSA